MDGVQNELEGGMRDGDAFADDSLFEVDCFIGLFSAGVLVRVYTCVNVYLHTYYTHICVCTCACVCIKNMTWTHARTRTRLHV